MRSRPYIYIHMQMFIVFTSVMQLFKVILWSNSLPQKYAPTIVLYCGGELNWSSPETIQLFTRLYIRLFVYTTTSQQENKLELCSHLIRAVKISSVNNQKQNFQSSIMCYFAFVLLRFLSYNRKDRIHEKKIRNCPRNNSGRSRFTFSNTVQIYN